MTPARRQTGRLSDARVRHVRHDLAPVKVCSCSDTRMLGQRNQETVSLHCCSARIQTHAAQIPVLRVLRLCSKNKLASQFVRKSCHMSQIETHKETKDNDSILLHYDSIENFNRRRASCTLATPTDNEGSSAS